MCASVFLHCLQYHLNPVPGCKIARLDFAIIVNRQQMERCTTTKSRQAILKPTKVREFKISNCRICHTTRAETPTMCSGVVYQLLSHRECMRVQSVKQRLTQRNMLVEHHCSQVDQQTSLFGCTSMVWAVSYTHPEYGHHITDHPYRGSAIPNKEVCLEFELGCNDVPRS